MKVTVSRKKKEKNDITIIARVESGKEDTFKKGLRKAVDILYHLADRNLSYEIIILENKK